MIKAKIIPFFLVVLLCCNTTPKDKPATADDDGSIAAVTDASAKLPLNTIKMPAGFSIAVYAEVEDARSMAMSPGGTLFVGNKGEDKVYAIRDTNGDKVADKKWVLATGLNMPNGVAFKDGALYVAENSVISKWDNIESKLANPGKPTVIYDKYPTEAHHGWKYIAFGPDGKLYVPVGAPCNICESKDPIYASITRMNADGSGLEVFANGVRNTVGFTWHPVTKEIWFTDNNRDSMGDDLPPCELNTAPKAGMHFGYPYCHAGVIKDPEFGKKRPCSDFTAPAQQLGAHVAPLGLKFYTGAMFPEAYRGHLFIAEHGSWDRSKKVGYKVSLVKVENNKVVSYEPFITGWLDEGTQKAWGRPVDVLLLEDGSMLVSDDRAGVIYRITYKG
ncbi:MAG: sorbosone dehydrogenase family protein [Cyclobacteriaceae bacterium]|nr:sorbosone dehydrogenase family protein [Cyclobacteriaceae bacterium]